MVLASIAGICRSSRPCHDFAFYRLHTPRPRGSHAPNRDERHSDQSATISPFRGGSFRIVNHSFTSKWDCWTSKDN